MLSHKQLLNYIKDDMYGAAMKRIVKVTLAATIGCLSLILPQQAIAQDIAKTERMELEKDARRLLPELLIRDHSIDFRDLESIDSRPVLQDNIPVRQENEVLCDSEGRPRNAIGWADNGDGTFHMVA